MINPCVFDPIALEAWYSDEESSLFIQTELEKYFQNYSPCFCSEPQRKLFRTFIRGLLSPLERKSIEPIALHFSGAEFQYLYNLNFPIFYLYHMLHHKIKMQKHWYSQTNNWVFHLLEKYYSFFLALSIDKSQLYFFINSAYRKSSSISISTLFSRLIIYA